MKKLLKSRKALSPVVAAIILIAVTVAVSIAVAAWMGSLTIGFMETSELTVTDVTFTDNVAPALDTIDVDVTNSGTSPVTVATVKVNSNTIAAASWTMTDTTNTVDDGASDTVVIDYAWSAGAKYAISLFASDGTLVGSYTDTA
jgi:flagellin-like protein